MEPCQGEAIEDGFESGEEDKVDLRRSEQEQTSDHKILVTEQMIRYIPAPQQIKEKPYSLHPDMVTGWAPKIALPKPVPLVFPHDPLEECLNAYYRTKSSQVSLIYLGPRFDSTYSAWRVYGVEFPYNHMGVQKVTVTDRRFQGMSISYPKEKVRFESMFESGNLDAVFEVGHNEFDCFMRVDANTRGHLQWYYFKMHNIKKGEVYQLNIVNFQKTKTLYTRGMRPYIYSYAAAEHRASGWTQGGEDIEYSKKRSKLSCHLFGRQDEEDDKYYTLSFKVKADYPEDTLEIAYCPPYTFTKLSVFVKNTVSLHKGRDIIIDDQLCCSLGGFKVPLLTLTSEARRTEAEFKEGRMVKHKGLVFCMARIHPGESNGSYVMEGFINWLCGYSQEAQELRNKYLFKIVPMVNPDGVSIGNYRAGLSGRDFNRQFIDPDASLFVEVTQLKYYLQRCRQIYQKQFNFFLDFHGHSIKRNAFAYGPELSLTHSKFYESKLLPKLLSKRIQLFRYYSCVFKVAPCKNSTARAVILRQYGVPFAYTIEASNGNYYDHELKACVPFTIEKWTQLGARIGESLFDYWMIFKEIEHTQLKRKKERQTRLQTKGGVSRRIQSSSFRSSTTSNVGKQSKLHYRSGTSVVESKNATILSEIINEITNQTNQEDEKCSDDQLSEGGSDSESSDEDLDLQSMRAILSGKSEGLCRVRRMKTREEPQREAKLEEADVRYSAFMTEFQDDSSEPSQKRLILDRKNKPLFLHKRMYTMSGSPSPPRPRVQDVNGSANVVSINFIMNPIPVVLNDKRPKLKTEKNEEAESRSMAKTQHAQSSRRTYLSLQRDSMKRQMMKRKSMQSNQSITVNHFRNQEVVGRNIYSDI